MKLSDHNLEMTWMGALLHHPETIPSVLAVCEDPSLIDHDARRELWRGMIEMSKAGLPVDPASLTSYVSVHGMLSEEDANKALLPVVTRKGSAANVVGWTRQLHDLHRWRGLDSLRGDLSLMVDPTKGKIEDVIAEVIDRLQMSSSIYSPYRSAELAQKMKEELKMRYTTGTFDRGLSLGVPQFDEILKGVLSDDWILISGRQHTGKTFLLLQFQRNLLINEPGIVPLVSLEMNAQRLMWRHASSLSGVDEWKVRSGECSQAEYDLAVAAYDFVIDRWGDRCVIFEVGNFVGDVTPAKIEAAVEAERLRGKEVTAVLGDNFGLMGGDTREEKDRISSDCKRMTGRMKCPFILVAHLNRSNEKQGRRPQLSDLRETGKLEQDADRILLMDRPDERLKHVRERWDELGVIEGLGHFEWAKNRNAPPGQCWLQFDPRTLEYVLPPEGIAPDNPDHGSAPIPQRGGQSTSSAVDYANVLKGLIHGDDS
jgi:replicative DNA helicase